MTILNGKTKANKKLRTHSSVAARPGSDEKMFNKRSENPSKLNFFNSIRAKLISGFLFTIIPIVLLGVISYKKAFNSIKDTAMKGTLETLKQLEKNIEDKLKNYEEMSTQIMLNQIIQDYLFADSSKITIEFLQLSQKASSFINNYTYTNSQIYGITLFLENDKTIDTSSNFLSKDVYPVVTESELMKKAQELSGRAFWVGRHSEIDELGLSKKLDYGISLVKLLKDISTGEERGLLVIDLKSDFIESLLKEVNLGDNSELHLISPDKRDTAFKMIDGTCTPVDTNENENNITNLELYNKITEGNQNEETLFETYKDQEYRPI